MDLIRGNGKKDLCNQKHESVMTDKMLNPILRPVKITKQGMKGKPKTYGLCNG